MRGVPKPCILGEGYGVPTHGGTGSGSGELGPLATRSLAVSMISACCPNCWKTFSRGQWRITVNWATIATCMLAICQFSQFLASPMGIG